MSTNSPDSANDPLKPVAAPQQPVSGASVSQPTAAASPPSNGPTAAVPVVAEELYDDHQPRRFGFLRTTPAWMVSTLIHVLILLVLGLVTMADPVKIVNVLTASSTAEDGPEIEEFTIEEFDPGAMAEMEDIAEPSSDMMESLEMAEPVDVAPMEFADIAVDMSITATELTAATASLQSLAEISVQPLGGRSKDMKKKLLREYGGNASSEAAVTEALRWLSRHQMRNGGWTFQHNLVCKGSCGNPGEPNRAKAFNAATSLALLPFMGAGQTHVQGDFRQVVLRGLRFLVQNGKAGTRGGLPVLDLSEGGGNMYSHGLAAITLCEAYAMTEDPELLLPAQAAINFCSFGQCADGGWRYTPKDKRGGDTSVTGWQVMALKSGYMGHLNVPANTIKGSVLFLDKVGSNEGHRYGYAAKPGKAKRPSCDAIGLLCRMYTGWDKTHPGIVKGVDYLSGIGVDKKDIYYDYYAAQVLRQYGGPQWDKFNVELRDWLVETQSQNSGAKGSWHFPSSKSHRGPKEGGRLASTAFATMILEVYYRHMPLYNDSASESDFPL